MILHPINYLCLKDSQWSVCRLFRQLNTSEVAVAVADTEAGCLCMYSLVESRAFDEARIRYEVFAALV